MRFRALFACTIGVVLLAIASPATAKAMIAEAHVRGPGLEGGSLSISGPATEGMWESGIDVVGGLDDIRADSVQKLGLTRADLGPRYVVTYRFESSNVPIRQDLYPYAKGGPVTYTAPGQTLKIGVRMAITAGWYRSSVGFFHFLVDHGLPKTNPVTGAASRESAPGSLPAAQATPWGWIALVLAGLVALSLVAPRLRRRILAVHRGRP